ncbi:ATP-binding protein [Microbacterium sp.]|uniref:ATP-binding protein n=1 Tax=Microbacterium sp. TaxID=51671 RepID=UPI002E3417FD|nr:ATP-binding protein [Microbacterium sp.]HEX5729978.1 ATP-binding protein [Microbacterium sp.]
MTERALTFRTPPDGVDLVHAALTSLWKERGDIDEMDRMMFETALIELASNVIQHATSSTAVVCRLEVTADDEVLRAVLIDSADPPGIDDGPRRMPDEFAESGRGLAFIQALVDEFEHHRAEGRNVWTISKRRSVADA